MLERCKRCSHTREDTSLGLIREIWKGDHFLSTGNTRPCVLSGDLILHVGKSGSWHCEEGRILEMGGVADEYHEVGKAATCGPGN